MRIKIKIFPVMKILNFRMRKIDNNLDVLIMCSIFIYLARDYFSIWFCANMYKKNKNNVLEIEKKHYKSFTHVLFHIIELF